MDEIEKLKKENEVKSDIISITAHQLRTSLSALKWTLKMFIDGDVGKLTEEQDKLIQKAYESNERVLAIVNDLLVLSHTEEVSISCNFQQIDLCVLLEKILFEFKEETDKKGIRLILKKPEGSIPLIKCDEEMMRVVVQNLVENSIKYSDPGEEVLVTVEQNKDDIQLRVHDNGIGINDEDKDRVFEKFFRAKNAMDKDKIGSGLGLFTTKNIIERHKGKIWFENDKDKGTTFFVSLPIL